MANYRNKKLRESAKDESCIACNVEDGTVVWCHSNYQRHGKGMGIKAHDLFGCYLCHSCHKKLDSGDYDPLWFIDKWEKSMIRACEKGYL